jgi:small-conductance mechanosensitive channel
VIETWTAYRNLWIPLAWLAGGLAMGVLFEKIVMKKIHDIAARTKWEGTNCSFPDKEMAVPLDVGVGYGSDLEKVERVACGVAKEIMTSVEGGVPEFEPFICYHTFGDSCIHFTVILRAREYVNQYLIKHEFIKKLHQRYREEGIEIPFPIRKVILERKKE